MLLRLLLLRLLLLRLLLLWLLLPLPRLLLILSAAASTTAAAAAPYNGTTGRLHYILLRCYYLRLSTSTLPPEKTPVRNASVP